MRNVLLFMFCVLIASCKAPKTITEREEIYVDRVEWRDTTIYIELPRESVATYCPIPDTLRLSTSLANAFAWVDTANNILIGYIENKKVPIEYKTKFKERKVTLQKTIQKTVVIEKKYIPKFVKYLMILMAILLVVNYRKFIWKIISKFL